MISDTMPLKILGSFIIFSLTAATLAAQPRLPNYEFYDSRSQETPANPAISTTTAALLETQVPAASGEPETLARVFLQDHVRELGLPGSTVFSLPLGGRYESPAAGLTHLVFQKRYAGLAVFGGDVLVHVRSDGGLLRVEPGAPWPAGLPAPALAASLSASQAASAALRMLLDLPAGNPPPEIRAATPEAGPEQRTSLASPLLREPGSARLVWFSRSADVLLAWEMYLHLDAERWYATVVDATTGEMLFSQNLYRQDRPQGLVFRAPATPNPSVGPPALEPFTGWPSTAGDCPAAIYPPQYRSGALLNKCWVASTVTAGNNVTACLDADGNNKCDWSASNALANFSFLFANDYALAGNAVTDRQAAVTNLFYWNNVLHDWLYGLGFDEPAGNFQANNFGRGGVGGDAVLADAQDGQVLNNSNFAAPPDGSAPRLQIGLLTDNGTFLRRDGDFAGDLITHEYVHGLTTRLVGGPGNSLVLPMLQSGGMSEGWSDAYAISFTNNPVFGQYLSATPATGIRSVAYNNSPYTFGQFGTIYRRGVGPLNLVVDLPEIHRDGEIWATALWDLRTALGKTDFERLVTTALKLTAARPSMLDARTAIVQAAQSLAIGGAGQCAVWQVFAARGFGASASLNHVQAGQPRDTALSVYESFDAPVACGGSPPQPGATLFSDDMESGPRTWIATGLWHQTSRRAAAGTHSWWYGQEATGNYNTGARTTGSLTSPPLPVPAGARALLEWDQLFKGEGFDHSYPVSATARNPYLNYDSGWVLVSRDGGATWETLTTLAHNSDSTAFDHHKIDFSRYAGSTVLVRFFFDTLDGNNNLGEGWYVDNVLVRLLGAGGPVLSVTPATLSFTTPAPQSLAVSNLGGGALNWTVAAASSGWLTVTPGSGTGNATLTVSAQSAALAPGTYTGTVTITAPGATGSPATVAVTLTVTGPTGPLAEWHFEEAAAGSGVSLLDSSGNSFHASTFGYGSAAFTGVAGRGRAFNGISDSLEVAPSPALSPASFTFRTWIQLLSYPSGSGWGAVISNYGGNYQGWYVGITSAGHAVLSVASTPSSAPWLVSNNILALGRWYCLTATYDGTTHQGALYLNGAFDVQTVFPGFTPQSAVPLTFGRASWYDGYYLNAVLDETRLDSSRLSASQVASDYQSFPAPPPAIVNLSLPAEWRLDDTGSVLADASGNNRTGTYTGTTPTSGVRNNARIFNGAGDASRVSASEAFSPASFTIRAWVKLLSYPQAAGWAVLASNYGGNYQGWYLGVHSSGRLIFSVASLPSSAPWVLSTSTLALNQWYYVAATYSGAARTATIYVDGAADAQAVLPGFTPNTSADLYLARASWYAGYYVNAALDEVRVEAVAHTAAEIVSDYQSFPAPTAPPAAVPLAEWLLDDTGSTLADATGNGHTATAFGSASTTGVRNGARVFNGVAERAEVPAAASLSPASFTVRAWVRLTALPTGWGVLVSNYGGNYQGWYLGVHASGQLIFSIATLPASAPWLVSTATLSPGLWYHVTATYDGASRTGALYVNGASDAATVFPGFTPQASLPLTFARASWYDGYYASVTLDEVRMMPVAQSPSEVLTDYQSFP